MHLNQDLSSPDHTRNDAHMFDAFFEKYGLKTYLKQPNAFPLQHEVFPWGGWYESYNAGFRRLEDFWDRHLYNGQSSALSDNERSAEKKLGLAEFTNGNFLGEDSSYREYFQPGQLRYFPLPSLNTSTDFLQIREQIGAGVDTVLLRNGSYANRVYLRKVNDGINVNHHSVMTYLANRYPRKAAVYALASTTINDPNVLSDYHSKLIPKAISYSKGLLNYFFRGYLAVDATINNAGVVTLHITQTSLQDMQGGSFKLYYDDANGNRNLVPGFTSDYTGHLKSEGTGSPDGVQATFTPPSGNVKRYSLVFSSGVIGVNSLFNPLDSVDQPIASRSFVLLWFQVSCDDASTRLNISDFHCFDGYDYNQGSSAEGELVSGDLWMAASTWYETRGEFAVQVASDKNGVPDHTVNCTLKTFFNSPITAITTHNFSIMALQGPGSNPDPPYYFYRPLIVIDGEYNLQEF